MEHVYNGKENTKYLKLLKQNYSSSQAVIREIVNLTAITNLPKGTEFFLSDIHGEYEAFLHIMNNCSGVIKEKVDLIFKDTLSEFDRQELCTLIYYPREKMTLLGETNRIEWQLVCHDIESFNYGCQVIVVEVYKVKSEEGIAGGLCLYY